jgi:hypothetical protein
MGLKLSYFPIRSFRLVPMFSGNTPLLQLVTACLVPQLGPYALPHLTA